MSQLLGYALVTPDRARVWCGGIAHRGRILHPGLWPWISLPRCPVLWPSGQLARHAAGRLFLVSRVRLTPILIRAP